MQAFTENDVALVGRRHAWCENLSLGYLRGALEAAQVSVRSYQLNDVGDIRGAAERILESGASNDTRLACCLLRLRRLRETSTATGISTLPPRPGPKAIGLSGSRTGATTDGRNTSSVRIFEPPIK